MTPRAPAVVVLAALVAVANGARGEDSSTACALRVVADPAELVLGETDRATVRIETGTASPPTLTVSAGRLEAPRAIAPGVFTADFLPPDTAIPQLAFVTASSGASCGWATIRLLGKAEALVRSTPGARIVVRIADRSYGPVRADAAGVARLPVVVPPGTRTAFHASRPIPLAVPRAQRAHIVLDRNSAPADREVDAWVRVFATTESGARWERAPVTVTASSGEIRLTEVGPGELVGRWQLPPGPARVESLAVRVVDGIADAQPDATVRLTRVAGPVARVELSPGLGAAGADVAEVMVDVRTADAVGNPVVADVTASVDTGTVSAPAFVAAGVARFSVRLPDDADGRDHVEVAAFSEGMAARSTISLVPGMPMRILAVVRDPVLTADGHTTGQLRFSAVDRRGVPVAAGAPRVRTPDLVSAVTPERSGTFVLSYRSPFRVDDATAVVDVGVAGRSSSAEVRLVGARGRLEFVPAVGIALTRGHAMPEVSLQATGWSRRLGPDLGLALDVGWSGTSETATATAGTPAMNATARYQWLLARGAWRRATSPRALLWITAGAGGARATSAVRVEGMPSFEEAAWVPAAAVSIGWGVRAWRGFPFIQVGARWQGDPGLTTLTGVLIPLTLSAGYRIEAF